MKKYIYILLTALAFTSCNVDDFLDVVPTGKKIPSTIEDFDKLLNDYNTSYPTWNNVTYMDPDVWMPGGMFDNFWRPRWKEQYKWSEVPYTLEEDDYDWIYKYQRIYVYNLIVNYAESAELGGTMTETDRSRVLGEALANRAFDYFFLVNEYGPHYSASTLDAPSVPIVLTTELDQQPPRATVKEVYDLIEKDLAAAKPLLIGGQAIDVDANFRPGSASVLGLEALVALYKGEFETAKNRADEALSHYSKIYDYTQLTNKDEGLPWSGLSIYDWDYSTDNYAIIWNRYHRWTYYDPSQLIHSDLVDLFDKDNDQRFILFSYYKTYFGVDVSPNYAYARYYAESNSGLLTEDLLMISAEAHIRTGDAPGALNKLNTLLRNRILNFSDYTTADFANDGEILQLIKDERRKEFMATGKNWFDLKRYHAYGESIPTFTRNVLGEDITLEPGSDKYIVPISQKIMNLNPNL